jgi:hypothetical protein
MYAATAACYALECDGSCGRAAGAAACAVLLLLLLQIASTRIGLWPAVWSDTCCRPMLNHVTATPPRCAAVDPGSAESPNPSP